MPQPFHNVCIDWDFDAESKSRLFAPTIQSNGEPIFLSVTEPSCKFFEISATRPTNVYIKEAFLNTSIRYSSVKNPFLFVRNVGDYPILVHTSNSPALWSNSEHQISGVSQINGASFRLSKGEASTISFHASVDGSVYSSKVDFGFGVFHEFTNVQEINPSGEYPALSGFTYQHVENYPTNSSFDEGYAKIKTHSANLTVDHGAELELSFSKSIGGQDVGSITSPQSIASKFGNHRISSCLVFPAARIKDNFSQYCVVSDFASQKFCAKITGDYCVKVTYPLSINTIDEKSYLYSYIGADGDSKQTISVTSESEMSPLSFSGSSELCQNNVYEFLTESKNTPKLNIETCQGYSLKSLNTKTVSRDNLFLPQSCDFSAPLSLELHDANFGHETSVNGTWGTVAENASFVNSAEIVAADSGVSQVYSVVSHLSESRVNTNTIQCKTKDSRSESFSAFYGASECSFCYSGIEYRYSPLCYVVFEGNCYPIPNCTMPMQFGVSGNMQSVDFPIRAANESTLKIIANFETIEKSAGANLTLSYSGIEFKKSFRAANDITFKYPKIKTPDLCGTEAPNLKVDFCNQLLIQKNIEFYVNPFGASGVRDYGLNNFSIFLSSQLNSGLALQSTDEYPYKSATYNFLMMDLQEEFPKLTAPTGDWCLIDQRIVLSPASYTTPMAYRSISGGGYNYILPISTGLNFCDTFCHREAGEGFSCVRIERATNYLSTGLRYYGGATGADCAFISDSTFSLVQNRMSVNIPSESLNQTVGNREFTIEKNYTFSGVQPIRIETNYPLLDIKSPIICTNLLNFSEDLKDENVNDIYYYVYPINGLNQKPLRFLAPDCTQIAMVTWKDVGDDKSVDFTQQCNPLGIIQSNAAQICFLVSGLVGDNPYNYSAMNSKININIVGTL